MCVCVVWFFGVCVVCGGVVCVCESGGAHLFFMCVCE